MLFSLKNYRPRWDLNPEPPRYQANMLPIELSWLGSKDHLHNSLVGTSLKLIQVKALSCWQFKIF